ncbi:hypothetical protein AB0305_20025 [Arthrobacter sp. NPDC080086]
MSTRLGRWTAWALVAVSAALIFTAWLTPDGAFSFVTLASFCG